MKAGTAYLIEQERNKVQAQLGQNVCGTTINVDRPVAKAILLYGNFIYNGRMLTPKAKHIGCGVYELSVKGTKL